jgi:NAD(P)-dependent dehydrogenase (short-subunit alcohol dehydrogenase family)
MSSSEAVQPMKAPGTYDALAALRPVGRLSQVRDIVDGILFLESSPFITGEILHIDGGQSAGAPAAWTACCRRSRWPWAAGPVPG